MTIEERLFQIQNEIDQAKTRRIQAATRLESEENRRAELLKECQELGVDPKNLTSTIESLEREIAVEVAELESLLKGNTAPAEPAQANYVQAPAEKDPLPF